ncbi:HlyD family type I secretion periplasmic adaptor subunit [Psychrobium sp. MM17-31]|uniref:HlyD family type I secretion periplasmic adaptor subunit n=1 Tax=Psychrobium sp. MM17-31 TaxID=2917758 RepID=UPI001EF54A11|nr:HlyD family type I secretion periplasmic adaptor subunit [Psychrobium sp. MM17-31]MCG7533292.1 HlyD family type I secretion periplasmic adaptor subunit [Psychrobium sp. MM17-31]
MKITQQDIEMADDVYGAMLTQAPSIHRLTIWALAALILTFIIWAYFASLEQVTSGEGKVIPSSQTQIVQSLDGGILEELYVTEGMPVTKGQPIARIDDTRFQSDVNQQKQEVDSLRANIIRLRAELSSILVGDDSNWRLQIKIAKKDTIFTEELKQKMPELVARQQQEYNGRLDSLVNQLAIQGTKIEQKTQEIQELDSKISTLKRSYEFANKELSLTRPLAEKNIIPEVELLKLERNVNDIQGELEGVQLLRPKSESSLNETILQRRETALKYRTDTRAELNKMQAELSRMNEAQVGVQDKVEKALMTSPVVGTIKTIHINTLGGVITPGQPLMEIVPTQDKLLIEAKIKPQDIAFLHPGLPAIVKVTAYDFAKYGGLHGKVEHISADTTQDDKGNSFYVIRVRTESSSIIKKDKTELPIIPGMMTTVDVITGKRTVLEYILNPVLRAKQSALREQ